MDNYFKVVTDGGGTGMSFSFDSDSVVSAAKAWRSANEYLSAVKLDGRVVVYQRVPGIDLTNSCQVVGESPDDIKEPSE